jgi:type IV pilus assembly protein PilC
MLFRYKAFDNTSTLHSGDIEAVSLDKAINALQGRGLVVSSITPKQVKSGILGFIPFFNKVSNKEIVILSRQISTLFGAKISALRIFKLIASEVENELLREKLLKVVDDLQGGSAISVALSKHKDLFSDFYINMVRSGEESGHLDETFQYLADYLDRTYEVTSKAKNALVYPAFVIFVFIAVMVLMFTVIIPKIGLIVKESAQDLPIYTKIVFKVSDLMINNGLLLIGALMAVVGAGIWYFRTPEGKRWLSSFRLSVPYLGDLYKKLYLSRFSDNMSTMVGSGIPMLKALEVTSAVIDNQNYKDVLDQAFIKVKAGSSLSDSLENREEMPNMLVQMIRVGEESGEMGDIMKTMAKFYQREVINAVDTLVGLIEPVMIVALGVGVGVLLASVLMPIYNIASSVN